MTLFNRLFRSGWRRATLVLIAIPPTALLLYTLILVPFTPSIDDIRKATAERPTQVLFADGKVLTEFKQSNRQWVKLADISPYVVDALISTEDHRFYQHHGLDFYRTGAAVLHTFSGSRQGGSTLTQQLARNLYPEAIGRSPTLTRKLKEAITAFKIEAVHSKDEILETYLNTVPFLYNAFGIEMAARTYFDTSAGKLDQLQSATLVGMLKGNTYYNPVLNPERSLQRRNIVLAQMVKHGKLPPEKLEPLRKRPLRIDFERQSEPAGPAPHFARYLRKWLIDWADRNDYNIYNDGLVVHTTLDSRLQNLANQAVARQGNQLQRVANTVWGSRTAWSAGNALVRDFISESPEYRSALDAGQPREQVLKQLQADTAFMRRLRQQKTTIQAGFLALDPRNGHIMAWVGSRNFEEDAFDHVQQARRQPGSTFKPFVYGEAFREGIGPDTTFVDQAVEIQVGPNDVWRPTDGTPPSDAEMSLRDGLAFSKNTITAQLMQRIGPDKVIRLAQELGVRQSNLEPVLSLALGTSPVTLREMTVAYASIADSGNYHDLIMVTRIEDRHGKVIAEFNPPSPDKVLDSKTAYTLLDVMRDAIDRGTGIGIRNRYGIQADVAGKTGTTQDNTDGWFLLMHPELVAGAWVGFNDSRVTLRSNYWGQGAHSALPIVGDVFRNALRSKLIDPQAQFVLREDEGALDRIKDWVSGFFGSADKPSKPETELPQGASPGNAPQDEDLLQEKIDQILEDEKREEQRKFESMYGGS